jgi:glycosyltransferase 2 family protein
MTRQGTSGFDPAGDAEPTSARPGPSYAPSVSSAVRFVLGLGVGALVAIGVGYVTGVKPADVVRFASGVSPWLVIGCVASSFVVIAFQSVRWCAVMWPLLRLTYGQAYRAQLVGFMFNALLPARGGDLLRVQYLGRRTGKSRATILGTEVVDRWLDWWGWIPTFLVLCVVSHPPFWLFKALGIFGSVLIGWALVMLFLTRRGFNPAGGTRFARIWTALKTGVTAFRSPRIWGIALLLGPLPWLWESLAISVAAGAFGIHISWLMAFSVLIGFNLAMVVPSPGSVGTLEAGGVAAMVFFHIDQSRALAFQLVYHLTQLLPGIVTGIAILVAEGEKIFGRKELPLDQAEAEGEGAGPDARRLDSLGQTSQSASVIARSDKPKTSPI